MNPLYAQSANRHTPARLVLIEMTDPVFPMTPMKPGLCQFRRRKPAPSDHEGFHLQTV